MSAVAVVLGDLAEQRADALVRDANVDTRALEAAGPSARDALAAIGRCPPGSATIATAGALPARFLIHAFAPRCSDGGRALAQVRKAYAHALELVRQRRLETAAFQPLGAVRGSSRPDVAAKVGVSAVRAYAGGTALREVTFVVSDPADFAAFTTERDRFGKVAR